MLGIVIGHHDVGGHPLPIGGFHTRHAGGVCRDAPYIDSQPHIHASFAAPFGECIGQGRQSTSQVPCTEGLLDVRHRHECRRCAARVRSLIRGVPIQDLHLTGVAQMVLAEASQRGEGCNGTHNTRMGGQAESEQGASPVQR